MSSSGEDDAAVAPARGTAPAVSPSYRADVASAAAEASNGTSSNIFQRPSRPPSHGSGGNKPTRGNKGHLCSLTVDVYIFPFKINSISAYIFHDP
jgi:hypothetical protein